jgi:hypothetical protein
VVEPRDGEVEDGQRTGTVASAPVSGTSSVATSPPESAPPVIAAAAPKTWAAHTRRTTHSAASPLSSAARLRSQARRRGVPLPIPGASRSLSLTTYAQPAVERLEQQTGPRPADDAQTPAPAAPAVSAGGALTGLSTPPPAAAYALLVAALAVAAAYFSALVVMPTRRRSVPFISLLERPG